MASLGVAAGAGAGPATAYRLENALRRAGIRASVEVLRDGTDAPDYHHAAMQYASQVPFARQAPTNPAPIRARAAAPPIAPQQPVTSSRPDFSAPGRRSRLEQAPEPPALPATVSVPESPAPAPPPAPEPDISDTAQMARQTRREAPDDPLASANPPSRPQPQAQPGTSWLNALPESTSSKPPRTNGSSAPKPGDDALSEQEKHLLRQLQEELARREQEESEQSGARALEARGRHGSQPGQFDWPNQNGNPTIINGVPPQPPDQRR